LGLKGRCSCTVLTVGRYQVEGIDSRCDIQKHET
jgi:hypothetical protein